MATPPKKYRRYLKDNSVPVSRWTLWRHKKRNKSDCETHLSSDESVVLDECIISDCDVGSPFTKTHSTSSAAHSLSQVVSNLTDNNCSGKYGVDTSPEISPHDLSSDDEASACSTAERSLSSASETEEDFFINNSTSSNLEDQPYIRPAENLPAQPCVSCMLEPTVQRKSDPFEPLYEGSKITVCGAVCAIMKFSTMNKLTYKAISDLLQLLDILLPIQNLLPKSFYKFKSFFEQFRPQHEYNTLCTKCGQKTCSTESCSGDIAHVVHLDVHDQLEKIVNANYDLLRKPTFSDDINDVWSGSGLKPLCQSGRFFSNLNNLAFSLSTDGVPLYKSSKISLWPVFLAILNLPREVRMNAENIILCGLWVGPCKPLMSVLLQPILKVMRELSTIGLHITVPSGDLIVVRGKLLFGVFDLPAKASVLCSKQFNGEYGCSVCTHPGTRLPNGSRVYLPNHFYPDRNHSQVMSDAKEAERISDSVKGIKGISPFSSTMDLVASFPVDYMHAVLEGATRTLTKAWFNSKHHGSPYYIGRYVKEIDTILMRQLPPSEISRPPRSIGKHLQYWKASELRNWLLYYSLPLLLNVLPPLYWHHYSLLVCAMHILLKDKITHSLVDAAEEMLKDFCLLLPELYDNFICTANMHLLLHLTKYVRLWGPLWTHSSFGFESKNGHLKHLFHGKANFVPQLLFNIDVSCTLQNVKIKLNDKESPMLLRYINGQEMPMRSNMFSLGDHTYAVGQRVMKTLSLEESTACLQLKFIEVFYRLYKSNVLYYSKEYGKKSDSKRDNTHCVFVYKRNVQFGCIKFFGLTPVPVAFIEPLVPSNTSLLARAGNPCRSSLLQYKEVDLLSSYIVPVDSTDNMIVVPIEKVLSKVFVITKEKQLYCIVQPNSFERH